MFGGPAFNLVTAVVQYDGVALTNGLFLIPNISSASISYLSF
jgi:hypothetical protein